MRESSSTMSLWPSFLFYSHCYVFILHLFLCISPFYVAHKLNFLKQHFNFVICLLGTPFSTKQIQILPFVVGSLIVRSQPNLSRKIHHSSHLGTFMIQSSWTYCAVKDTLLFSLIFSVHALSLSETIFLQHSHFAITSVKLCQVIFSDSLSYPH